MEKSQETFVVSARKYRPSVWDEVIGQKAITETLKTSIEDNHLAHAYLFCGPRGVGKTTCARIFAREINQTDSDSNTDFSFNMFELDAASNNKVDDIRQLTDQVRIPPQVGKYKVYIIDEVHMLTQQAFNAFLKTLEEPPEHAIFILATTEKHKIIPTILSRCQIYDFNRISVDEIVNQLTAIAKNEGVEAEQEALHTIAQKADGAMRDALSIFDQLVSFSKGKLTRDAVLKNLHVLDYDYYFKLTASLIERDYSSTMLSLDEILKLGFDPIHFISGLGSHFRDLLVAKNPQTVSLLEVSPTVKSQYSDQSEKLDEAWLLQGLNEVQQAENRVKQSMNARLLLEVTLLNIASFSTEKKTLDESSPRPNLIREKTRPASKDRQDSIGKIESKDSAAEQSYKIQEADNALKAEEEQPTPIENDEGSVPESIKVEKDLQRHVSRKRRKSISTISINGDSGSKAAIDGNTQSIGAIRDNIEYNAALDLPDAWKRTIDSFGAKNNTIQAILARTDINKMDDNKIEVKLQHRVEGAEFDLLRSEILEKLRGLTGNDSLQLVSTITETESTTKLFTPKDKYEHLASINPSLDTLRKRLDLDLTF